MSPLPTRNQAQWLLVIVHLSGRVEGITRLHKLAFLTKEWVPGMERGFYDDWQPSKYGPFSRSLAEDVDALVANQLLRNTMVQSAAGYSLERFEVTPLGASQAADLEQSNQKLTGMIKKSVVEKYATAPLMSLLHDVYYMFPEYTTESEIAGDIFNVGRRSNRNY
jgi:uncharacterized protein YwgA